jgi:cell division transport system ATP-binding protein
VLLADEPTGNLDPATSVDIMQLLSRINAGGTTILMATHEAGFVDQMQRRVIELSDGEMVRDERHGGYGDTSGIPSLAPLVERGAASVAALTAVLEVQREVLATDSVELAAASTIREPEVEALHHQPDLLEPDPEPETDEDAVREAAASAPEKPTTVPRTDLPIAVDIADLGVADRLGLSSHDDEDEVGPTT